MNNSSIEEFHQDFLFSKELPQAKPNHNFGYASFISDIAKEDRSLHHNRTKSLHKSQLNKTSLFFPDNSQFNQKCSKNLSKIFSESKISYKESSFSLKKTGFGESVIEKLRKWEQGFEIDEEFHEKLSQGFSDLEHKIQTLEAQFSNAVSLNKKLETQIFENMEIAKGWQFLKISFKNPKKSNMRTVFFSENLEAICWKDPKTKLPKLKQMIFLKDIRDISVKTNKIIPGKDMTCFISIETSRRSLDLIAPNLRVKEVFIKLISSFLKNFKQNFEKDEELLRVLNENREFGFLNNQYNAQIELIRKEIIQTKVFFEDVAIRLRKNFFETAQIWLKEQKNKGLVIKNRSNKCEERLKKALKELDNANSQKNKLSKELSETLLKNKHLLKQMKQFLQQSNNFSCDLMKVIEDIREYLKKINQFPDDFELKQLENLSFNQIDSHYLEFDKMSNFSHLNELKKVIDCLIKSQQQNFTSKEISLDMRKLIEENDILKKNNQNLQIFNEQIIVENQTKEEFLKKIEKKFIELNFKQKQLSLGFDKNFDEIYKNQINLKEDISNNFNQQNYVNLMKQKEDLEKFLNEKSGLISSLTNNLENQKGLFENKLKDLLKKNADKEIEINRFLKNQQRTSLECYENDSNQIVDLLKETIKETENSNKSLQDKEITELNLTDKIRLYFDKFQKNEAENKESIKSLNSLKEELKDSKKLLEDLKSKLIEKTENENLHDLQMKKTLNHTDELKNEINNYKTTLQSLDIKIKEKEENEKQIKQKNEFTLITLNSLKKLYEENKATLIELKKNLLIMYFSFMVILSSYHENKENNQANANKKISNDLTINYSERFRISLQILFNILSEFFPKTDFKELDNAVKKIFNLVVKIPTEFNKKPLDELYMKLDKAYNKIYENDVSLNSVRSFSMDTTITPKMNEMSFKFNN